MTRVILPGPIFSQLDNQHGPYRSCNVTSFAMCLSYLGMLGTGQGQFEDQLYKGMEDDQLTHGDPRDLSYYAGLVGARMKPPIRTSFISNGTPRQIRRELDKGYPVVVHGWFTPSGHIVAVFGYDDDTKEFLIHDPYGEWYEAGYDNNASGIYWLSLDTFMRLCDDGGIWMHTFSGGKPPVRN